MVCGHLLSNHHLFCRRIHFVLLFIIICCPDLYCSCLMKLMAASKQHRHVHTMCTGDQLGQSSFYHKVNRYYLPDIGQCADIAHFKKLLSLHICCLGILNFNNRSIQKNGFLHKIIQVEQASCDKLQCHPLLSLTLSKEYQILFEIPSTKFDCHPNCHHIYHINTMQ